jgi:PEP-CTERM/exosortase A-associated glycosyltransferase
VVAGYTSRSRYIVNAQRALGLDPIVLTSVRQPNPEGRAMEEIDGIRYHRTLLPATPKRRPALEMHHLRRRIVEVARREEVDVIHGHSSILCGLPSYVAARQLGLPSIYEIRAFWEDAAVTSGTTREGSFKYRAIQLTETALAKRVDALVCICAGIKDEMVRRGIPADRIHVVANGVQTDSFVPVPPDEGARARYGLVGKKVVAYIGTLFPFEGVGDLVRAMARLVKDEGRDDIRALIVGEGPSHEACKAITAAAGLADKVLHLGRVPHDEVKALYSISDVLVYPRERGRLTDLVTPLKPLEAMAMEKAVVGSDVGGLRELIQDEVTGLIHRPGDSDDLAAKIRRLADDESLRRALGRRAREWVVENRQWRTLIERNLDLYDRARGSAGRVPVPVGSEYP